MTQSLPSSVETNESLALLQGGGKTPPTNTRPGWSFDLDPSALGMPPGSGPDFWTPEQREKGVTLDFVYLTYNEELDALGEASKACRPLGVSVIEQPVIMVLCKVKKALVQIDGKPIPHLDRARAWEAFSDAGRTLMIEYYNAATGLVPAARERAAATFRVRS